MTPARIVPHTAPAPGDFASAEMVRAHVERIRERLVRMRTVRAVLIALAVALCVVAAWCAVAVVLRATGATSALLDTNGLLLVGVGAAAFAGTLAWLISRFSAITAVRAALWYEEREPRGHAVVTLVDTVAAQLDASVAQRLAQQSAMPRSGALPASEALGAATLRAWQQPAVAVAVAAISTVTLLWLGRTLQLEAGTTAAASVSTGASVERTAAIDRLRDWRIDVTPPAYAAQAPFALTDSGVVQALVGSRVRVSARGDSSGLVAVYMQRDSSGTFTDTLAVGEVDGQWAVTVPMPSRPAALRLIDGDADRVLSFLPRADSTPVVRLLSPLRDSVYRDSVGEIGLSAEASDDLGLASVEFELIVTSGSGERFTARTEQLARREPAGARTSAISQRLTFTSLGLMPGDVVHMRAVARDRNPARTREPGVSETRSIRIARADEYDSVAVDAAPPPAVDSSLLSQRMLLLLTERLEARRPRLERSVLVNESRRLAAEQARIRRAVSAIVFQRMGGEDEGEHAHTVGDGHDHGLTLQEGKLVPSTSTGVTAMAGATPPPLQADMLSGEAPVVGINRPLLEAYNAMWDAGRALELADTEAAIPPMRLALEAIQRARAAERVYLRGNTRPVVVDLARVRLSGKDTGQASSRRPTAPRELLTEAYDVRLLRAVERLPAEAPSARDSLLALRLEAIETLPEFAAAMALALDDLSAGRDPTASFVRARRALTPPERVNGVSSWSVP